MRIGCFFRRSESGREVARVFEVGNGFEDERWRAGGGGDFRGVD